MQPRAEYPRPLMRRPGWTTLNGAWDFGLGTTPRFDQRIIVPFCPQSRLSGIGGLEADVTWYRRQIPRPPGACIYLRFGAVDYRATVWVNDVEVARHEGGHTPFGAEITGALRDGENTIIVRAEDPLTDKTIPRGKQYWKPTPESIFYTPTSGIWQTVWLESVPPTHIRALETHGDLDGDAVDCFIDADGKLELTANLDDAVVGRWSGPAGPARIELDRVVPWSPESPRLYHLEARLLDVAGREHDRVESYFGLRKVDARDGCFLLNGEPYVQRLVLDQGYFDGGLLTAASDADFRRDIVLAKAFGFNGARKHQKIEDPRWLYWADVLGFLVWSEMPSFHEYSTPAAARLRAEWQEAIVRDRSHPCIVAWVPENESFGLDGVDPALRTRFLVDLSSLTHALDATRPVSSNDGWEHALTDLCTVHDYGPAHELQGRYRSLASVIQPGPASHPVYLPGYGYRHEPVLVSEFGGLKLGPSSGWGFHQVRDAAEFVDSFGAMVDALMEHGPVEGFCYTQLTDIEQEQNGLLAPNRVPKVDPPLIRAATQTPKRR
jgi:beta-galactosidase/beta-glucuronidase